MKKIMVFIVFFSITLTSYAEEKTFLSSIKKGDKVILKEQNEKYHLQILFDSKIFSHTVIETGKDYLLLSDITEMIELRIPIYSIKSITKMNKFK